MKISLRRLRLVPTSVSIGYFAFISCVLFRVLSEYYRITNDSEANSKLPQNEGRGAIVSLLTSTRFVNGAKILAFSILKWKPPDVDLVMLVIECEKWDPILFLQVQVAGWNAQCVTPILPPREGYREHYKHQFTKLLLWNMTTYSHVLYMDADTIATGNLSELFQQNISFGATVGFNSETRQFRDTFNCGLLFVKPNAKLFEKMMGLLASDSVNYEPDMAEQSWLNELFQKNYTQLPPEYNLQTPIYAYNYTLWKSIRPRAKVIHYINKAFSRPSRELFTNEPGHFLLKLLAQMKMNGKI